MGLEYVTFGGFNSFWWAPGRPMNDVPSPISVLFSGVYAGTNASLEAKIIADRLAAKGMKNQMTVRDELELDNEVRELCQ